MVIKEILQMNIDRLDVELILSEVLKVDRIYLHLNLDRELTLEEEEKCTALINERKSGRPMAYILGTKEFMGLDFFVKEGVLIPRPDTEILVEEIINEYKTCQNLKIADIGTGSGAISISLAKYLNGPNVFSLDISDIPLEVGKINAKSNGVLENITFLKSDVLSAVEDMKEEFDIIVSNPPYIRKKDIDTLDVDVKDFEPHLALDGGVDGLDFYRRISKTAAPLLKAGGMLAFEVGYDQAIEVGQLLEEDYREIRIIKDLSGIDRVVIGYKI